MCNNAGTGGVSEGYMWEHDLADWRWGIDVNVLGVIHGIKAFVPILLEQGEGHIVNTCSGNGGFAPIARGAMGGPATAVYPMTKAAVLCLTESLYTHLEMTGARVRAQVLFPAGFLNTGIWESWRHRPKRYAATQERRTPDQTLEKVMARFESAGARIEFTPLEAVADQVIEGIRADSFWMMGPPAPSDAGCEQQGGIDPGSRRARLLGRRPRPACREDARNLKEESIEHHRHPLWSPPT